MNQHKKRGPKPKPTASKRGLFRVIRLTTAEDEAIRAKAKSQGISVSELLRKA